MAQLCTDVCAKPSIACCYADNAHMREGARGLAIEHVLQARRTQPNTLSHTGACGLAI